MAASGLGATAFAFAVGALPTFLGGTNTKELTLNGPWDDYELIDSNKEDDTVGLV